MLVVACSGFPIAVSRYLNEFMAVEISDTEIGIPGMGTIRRWQRESPTGFVFTVLAPAEIGASGFQPGGTTVQALKGILSFCKKLNALALVFRVPADTPCNRTAVANAKKLLSSLPKAAPQAILDAPGWRPAQVDKICAASGAVPAREALRLAEAPKGGKLAYLTLPGPAGHRSRYDEDTIDQIADICRRSAAETTVCVFRNIDMESNAKTLLSVLSDETPIS